MVEVPTLRDMLKAGVHFGHKTSRWNPNMDKYIFTAKSGVHVINLEETAKKLDETLAFLKKASSENNVIVFVGTKKQANEIVKKAAQKSGSPYVNFRWIGGMLTNFDVIKKAIDGYKKDIEFLAKDDKAGLSKKELSRIQRKVEKGDKNFGGLTELKKKPDVLILIGAHDEKNAILEARAASIKTIALVDTNSNPGLIDYPIPANDDATKSLELFSNLFADAINEGKRLAVKKEETK
jgi:small subunit ribosomal protein S2